MNPDCVWLANIGPENRRLIHNALAPLGWKIEDSSLDRIAGHSTPETGVEVLIIEAPPVQGRPVATGLPTLWLLPPATVIPQVAGEGPHDFIRLPAPCEVIVARCLSLVRATLRERALRRYEREAIAQYERRRGLVARIAHQLASPLSAVIEYLELLLESPPGELGPRQREMLEDAKRAARRTAEKVEEIVDATAAESGIAIEVALARTDVPPILEEVLEWAVPKFRGRGDALSIQLEPEVPAICADRERLSQALRHLIENAACFAPRGGRIEIAAARDPGTTGFARISVAVHTPAAPGTDGPTGPPPRDPGMDLAFAGAIAAALGGFMRIAEPTASGSRVDICLPIWDSRAARIAEAQSLLSAPGRIPGGSWVCRIAGERGIAALEDAEPWTVLSPREVLILHADPPEGATRVGRVRDLREPGSLARALQPELKVQPKRSEKERMLRCRA